MTKCIYCGQYGEQYKSCAFCGAPHMEEQQVFSGKKSYMSELRVPKTGLVNIRNQPSFSGKVIGQIPVGSLVSPQEFREGWIKIEKNQWVSEKYVIYPMAYGQQL